MSDNRARQITELEAALSLPLPAAARRPLEAELARLRAAPPPVVDLSRSQVGHKVFPPCLRLRRESPATCTAI